jgi:hypothetical protein
MAEVLKWNGYLCYEAARAVACVSECPLSSNPRTRLDILARVRVVLVHVPVARASFTVRCACARASLVIHVASALDALCLRCGIQGQAGCFVDDNPRLQGCPFSSCLRLVFFLVPRHLALCPVCDLMLPVRNTPFDC